MITSDELFYRVRMSRRFEDARLPEPTFLGRCSRNSLVLRIWKVESGWSLVVEPVDRMALGHWVNRVREQGNDNITAEAIRNGEVVAVNERQARGFEDVLDHDLSRWPTVWLRLDCKHGPAIVQTSVLTDGVREATRRGIVGLTYKLPTVP